MNILVTGGAGFIGSNISDEYIKMGHKVIIIDNLSTGVKSFINPEAIFYEMDIRDEKLGKIFEEHKIDVINHHAAQIDLRKSVENPKFDIDNNIIGSINLLQYAVKYGVKKVIYASTGGAIYGEHEYFPADEEHPIRPYAPYGIDKLAVEKYLFYYNHVYNLDYIILRYANVYGPRQNPYGECGVVAIFTEKILQNVQPLINGDGEQTRDYVYVDDVVNANVLALNIKGPKVYNIGTAIETTVNYIFKDLNKLAGTSFREDHGSEKKGEQRRSVLSYNKINHEIGWEPKVKIEEGLRLTIKYFKRNN
ncbi:MAG: NAD-dependent epimerase/dehydratase family protein [Ignavibacteria bacterium]|jgi:UDP-glucose 4-epimerase